MTMKDEIEKLHDKVDKIDDKLDQVDKHLAVYNEQLIIHIKSGEAIHQASMQRDREIEEDLKPIKEHVQQLRGVAKFIGLLSLITGIMLTIKALVGK